MDDAARARDAVLRKRTAHQPRSFREIRSKETDGEDSSEIQTRPHKQRGAFPPDPPAPGARAHQARMEREPRTVLDASQRLDECFVKGGRSSSFTMQVMGIEVCARMELQKEDCKDEEDANRCTCVQFMHSPSPWKR